MQNGSERRGPALAADISGIKRFANFGDTAPALLEVNRGSCFDFDDLATLSSIYGGTSDDVAQFVEGE